MKSVTCSCGAWADFVRYVNGKKVCQRCSPQDLSGTFLRRLEGDARYYQKDILQVTKEDGGMNPNFVEVYGKEKANKILNGNRRIQKKSARMPNVP